MLNLFVASKSVPSVVWTIYGPGGGQRQKTWSISFIFPQTC